MYNNHELQDQDLHPTTSDQIFELDDNELDNITGGLRSPIPVSVTFDSEAVGNALNAGLQAGERAIKTAKDWLHTDRGPNVLRGTSIKVG